LPHRLSAAIHETAAGLHRIGLMNNETMREFDASCLTAVEPLSAKFSRHCAFKKDLALTLSSVELVTIGFPPQCCRGFRAR
jgi:hypothetical protein